MLTRSARPRRPGRDESGLTLIELLITMTLMLVAVTVAGDGLFNLGRSSASAQLHSFSLTQNRVGMERLTYLIRQATYGPDTTDSNRGTHPIVTNISATGVTFTSRVAGSSTIRRFTVAVNGNKLQIGQGTCGSTDANGNCVWSTPVMRDLITNIQLAANGPCASKGADGHAFRFFVASSPTASLQEIKLQPDPVAVANGGPPNTLSSSVGSPSANDDASLSQIDTVQISLFTQESGAGISNTCESLAARVNLRNLVFQ